MTRCKCCFERYKEEIAGDVCPYCGYHFGFAPKDPRYLPIGTEVNGRYVVGGVIGDGGFGITYRAWDTTLQVCVALKEYYQRGLVNRIPGTTSVFIAAPNRAEEFYYGKDRLLKEAQIVSKFQSESVMRVNDFFEENGTSYMVMELLDYPTLEEYLKERNHPLDADKVRKIAVQVCEALKELHKAEVIHRDIAPDNIFITTEGKIKLIDFGSARLSKEDIVEGMVFVKDGFSPIEQYEVIDPKQELQQGWTDLYALGATLYYCLTGVRPEVSRSRKALVDEGKPDIQEPRQLNPNVPEDLNNIIMKAMAINSHERFQTADEMLVALRGEVKVLPLPVVRKRKRLARAMGIGGALLIATIIILFATINGAQQYDEITLEPANITVWYSIPANDDTGRKISAMETIIQAEQDSAQFDEVTIELRGIAEDEYAAELQTAYEAGVMPTLFECVDQTAAYTEDVYDVSVVIGNLDKDTRACWFLNDYKSTFSGMGCIPTGFDVPVIYINTTIVTDYTEETTISSMADLLELAGGNMIYMPIAIDSSAETLYQSAFSDYDSVIGELTVVNEETFLDSGAAVFLSTTAEFLPVSEQLAGRYAFAQPDTKMTLCQFRDFWSISGGTEAEQTAAEVLLAYFYTDNVQVSYYIPIGVSTALPLNKYALNQFCSTYWQFGNIVTECDRYTFG